MHDRSNVDSIIEAQATAFLARFLCMKKRYWRYGFIPIKEGVFCELMFCQVLLLAAVMGCSAHGKSSGRVDVCLPVISAYVSASREWTEDVYDVVPEAGGGGHRGFAVMHHADKVKAPSEELKSFHVDLDSKCKAVVGELGYQ